MTERDSWAVGSDTDRRVDVEDARLALGALWTPDGAGIATRPGFRPGPGSGGRVTASAPTADVNVHVAAFQYVLPTTRGVGPYLTTLDSSKTIDILTANPADPANPRRDLIVAQQSDTFYGDASSDFLVRHIVGTPSPTPSDPTIDGSPDYVTLARVTVPAGATAITSSAIADLRPVPLNTVAVGGILPIGSAAERAGITDPYASMTIYRTDWGWIETYDGTAWRVSGVATASNLTAIQTGVTDPYDGQVAVVRDTYDTMYVYNAASGWKLRSVEPIPWQNLTISGTNVSIRNAARVQRLATGQVELHLDLNLGNGTTSNAQNITTLPSWAVPVGTGRSFPCAINNVTNTICRIDISTGGVCQTQCTMAGTPTSPFAVLIVTYTP